MIRIANPRGWQGVDSVFSRFETELRKKLGAQVILWPLPAIAAKNIAVISRGKSKSGYLLKLEISGAGFEEIVLEASKLKQFRFEPKFVAWTLALAHKIVNQLLVNHSSSA